MINAYFLPSLVKPEQLRDRVVVVIDVLRATTTIVHALAAGAQRVIPCGEVDEAQRLADQLGPDAVTGGERGGVRIPQFDLGNSPTEYTPQRVAQKTVVFTTTNGTQAVLRCREAARVLLAAFVNFSAVCQAVAPYRDFDLLCSGTNGEIAREDVLLAGAIVADRQSHSADEKYNDQAEIAADVWRRIERNVFQDLPLWRILQQSHGGRHLLDLGHDADIEIAAQLDRFDLVPELDRALGFRAGL